MHDMPPSNEFLRLVSRSLSLFPTDSFLNTKQNALFIYILNGLVKAREYGTADSLLAGFAQQKIEKYKHPERVAIKKFDAFVFETNTAVYREFYKYMLDYGLIGNAGVALRAWYRSLTGRSVNSPGDYIELLKISASHSFNMQESVEAHRIALLAHPGSNELRQLRLEYCRKVNDNALDYYSLLPAYKLNDAVAKDFPKDGDVVKYKKNIILKLIVQAADSSDFYLAYQMLNAFNDIRPVDGIILKNLSRELSVKDFRNSYYGSRINIQGKTEKDVPLFEWKGNTSNCEPGKMKPKVQAQMINRINYFRRQSGVMEAAYLSDDLNSGCEWAALMCEANGSMSHEPSDGWRCFVPAGLDALKLSILSKDNNPSIAVTAAMGQNHPTVGNRRWLQYPFAKFMGVGCALNYTAILAVDRSADIDTNKYRKQFVAWPNAYCPDMLLFKKWSFSMDIDLRTAVVSMSDEDGATVEITQQVYEPGYGLNTLVWEPLINAKTSTDKTYVVTVKIPKGKTYTYSVEVFPSSP
jgi:hypothetical protein